MTKIEEIGIENIIKAMNEHYKKFGRDKKFEKMEQALIGKGTIKDWYEICKDVKGIDIDYFSRILATEYNKHEFLSKEFGYIQNFLELESANHKYFTFQAEHSPSASKLAWSVNNIKGINVDYVVEKAIKEKYCDNLFALAQALPEKRKELAEAYLSINVHRFDNNYFNFVDVFADFAKLEGLNPKDFEDRFYYLVNGDSQFAEHGKFVEALMQIKEIDCEKLANWSLRRKPIEIIRVLNGLYLTRANITKDNKDYYAKRLLDNLFSRPLKENDYRELHFYPEHLDYLVRKVTSNPCKENCITAINLFEVYDRRLHSNDKRRLKDLIVQNTTNPQNVYKLSKFMPEAQEECEDAIIRLMHDQQAKPEDLMHYYIEITKQGKNQDKMLDALIDMVNHLKYNTTALSVYYSNIESADVNKITECMAKHDSLTNIYSWLSNFRGKQQKQLAQTAYFNGRDLWELEEIAEFKHDFNIKSPAKEIDEESPLDIILEELNK